MADHLRKSFSYVISFLYLQVENELRDICNDVLGLLDKFLIPKVIHYLSRPLTLLNFNIKPLPRPAMQSPRSST